MVELMILSPLIYTLVFVCLFGFYTYTQHLWIHHQMYQALICMASENGKAPLFTDKLALLKGFASSGKAPWVTARSPRRGFTSQKERSEKRVTARNPRRGFTSQKERSEKRVTARNPRRGFTSQKERSEKRVTARNPRRGCEGEMRRKIKALLLLGELAQVKFKKGASKWSGFLIWKTKFWQIPYKKTLTLKRGRLL